MANTDKNIVITPNIGSTSDPKIVFSGADASTAAQNITLTTYPLSSGTLSFDGSAGQLFSITNSLSGTLFSVNDVSGIPSIEVLDTGAIKLAQYGGNVGIGLAPSGTYKLEVNGGVYATSITGLTTALSVGQGGTGVTTAQAEMNRVAAAVTSGYYLRGNGTNVVMAAITADDVPTLNQNTTGTAGGLSATLAIASGGTGAITASAALTSLGAYAASNPSGYTTNVGTVTSVSALTINATGTDVTSTIATGTTTPVITLNIPTASSTARGLLSSADWSTFNGKQAAGAYLTASTGVTTLTGGTTGLTPSTATSGAITLAGTLVVGNGGTGITTAPTAGGIVWGATTSTQGYTAAGTAGQVLISAATSVPTWTSSIALSGSITTSGTGGIGYATGAGGTVSQATSRTTGVTLSKYTGQITLFSASLAAATSVAFTLTNTNIAASDVVIINHISGGTLGLYNFAVAPAAGSAVITMRNNSATASAAEAPVIQFVVIKAVTA